MAIQWFPGHMNAARKQVEETMAKVDMVIEILDARMPWSSSNPMIEKLRKHRQRPALKIINKADLADPKLNKIWIEWFRNQPGTEAMLLGQDTRASAAHQIQMLCKKIAPHRTGQEKPLRAMIMGIPNVGKSTLMNHLARRKVANVADTPGVTKSQQRIETLDGVILYDTPGLMWPKVEVEACGYRLALGGSIGRNAYDEVDVAWFAIETLRERYPDALPGRYGLQTLPDGVEDAFNAIARKRGAVLGGNRVDSQKAAEIILTDFRSGTLGRLSLETPDDICEPDLNVLIDQEVTDQESQD